MSGFIPMTPENAFQISAARRNRLPDDLRDRLDDWTRDRMMQEACAEIDPVQNFKPSQTASAGRFASQQAALRRRQKAAPEIERMVDKGMQPTKIARIMGFSDGFVNRVIDEFGLRSKVRPYAEIMAERHRKALELYVPGEEYASFAKRTGIEVTVARSAIDWGRRNGVIK